MRYTIRLYSALYPDRVLGEPGANTRHQLRERVRFYLLEMAHQYDRADVVNARTGRVLDAYVRHHGVVASRKALDAAAGKRAYTRHRYIVYRNRTATAGAAIAARGAVICRVHCEDPAVVQTWLWMEWPDGDAAMVAYGNASTEMRGRADHALLVTFPTDPVEHATVAKPTKVERAVRMAKEFGSNARVVDVRRREDGSDDWSVVLVRVGRRHATALYAPDNNPVFLPRFQPTARLARADFNQRLA